MTAARWPVITCIVCGTTGPGRRKAGLCKRCYARVRRQTRPCVSCGQERPHLAAGLCARCYRLSRTRLVTCPDCGELRPVWFAGRCERCKRRAAARAGACRDCGKQVVRLWSGRCRSCDAKSREVTGACRDCGDLTRLEYGLCRACRLFRWAHPVGTCPWCGRQQPIGAAGACRSCQCAVRAARVLRKQARASRPRPTPSPPVPPPLDALTGYGQARGWAPNTLRQAWRAVTAVLGNRDDLGQPPWDAGRLRQFLNQRHLVALRAVEFLTDQGLAQPTPQAAFDRWLAARLAVLRAPVDAEVRTWAEALQGRGPRAGPARQNATIQGYLRILQAPLAAWSARYESLRQVTTDDLAGQLAPLSGATRLLALSAMRSLFATLKARRVLFTNPAAPLTGRRAQPPPVLPLDDGLRAGLLGRLHNPAERLIVLLAGVHALRPSDICALTLDDADPAVGMLLADGRARPLDRLTAGHLRAWLQARHARWPATANPYLLINRSTAGGLDPVSRSYIQAIVRRAGITAQDLRADRLHDEAHATGGDPLRLARLFRLSHEAAIRYCAETGTLDQATVPVASASEQDPAPILGHRHNAPRPSRPGQQRE
jgi:integrase